MKNPFINDPFAIVFKAYQNLYNNPCEIYWGQHLDNGDKHENEYGYTSFPYDDSLPEIHIFAEHPVTICVETLAHELAHVAVGVEHDHDAIWGNAFNKIFDEYNRLGEQLFEVSNNG